ncbi:MAG TPA: YraN family protein [Acidimicrobiales bacterium]
MTRGRRRLGIAGEDRAAQWYAAAGYQVLARNWRGDGGEIDLVAAGHGALVFAEVKTRSSSRFGLPAEAVGPEKQRRLRGLAAQFLRAHPGVGGRIRFDVVAILEGRLQVIEAAF